MYLKKNYHKTGACCWGWWWHSESERLYGWWSAISKWNKQWTLETDYRISTTEQHRATIQMKFSLLVFCFLLALVCFVCFCYFIILPSIFFSSSNPVLIAICLCCVYILQIIERVHRVWNEGGYVIKSINISFTLSGRQLQADTPFPNQESISVHLSTDLFSFVSSDRSSYSVDGLSNISAAAAFN